MSRFIDRLREAWEGGGHQPMGFARAAQKQPPSLLTILALSSSTPETVAAAVEAGADALLLSLDAPGSNLDGVAGIAEAAGKVPWGVSLSAPAEETVQALRERGCDYLVFPLAQAPISILQEEEMGKVLTVDARLEERLARGVEQLAVDAVLARVEVEGRVTLDRFLEYLYLFSLTGQPLLVNLPQEWTAADLEELRDDGVSGLVVPFAGREQAGEVRRLKEALASLGPRSRRKEALHPRVPPPSFSPRPQEMDEEEEEEDE